jgi:hypothetical protein
MAVNDGFKQHLMVIFSWDIIRYLMGIYHQHCHNLPKHVQCPELAVFHGISGIMMNYDHPSYFGRPMTWWTSTGDQRYFGRPVRCASLRTWWGRP